ASGVTNIATGNGLLGGPITTTGSISVNAGLGANQIVQRDGSGNVLMGGHDFLNVGNVSMASGKSLGLGLYTGSAESTATAGMGAADTGKVWYNTTLQKLRYWDGSSAVSLGIDGAGMLSL